MASEGHLWDYLCTGTVLTYESMPRSPELSNVGSLTTGLRICPKWTMGLGLGRVR